MEVPFLDLRAQYADLRSEIDAAIRDTIDSGAFVGGHQVAEFETEFAAYQHAEYSIGVGNGTDALEIALEGLDLPPESDILVPANSFIATSEAVTRTGHRVVFCDADPDTMTIDLDDAERRITSRTAALICVHLYGSACDMGAVADFAHRHRLRVVEDAAQAHGSEWKGKRVGAIGDIGCFSFYPGKTLGAYGDGGAITTNDAELARRCRMIANHGRIAKYNHEFEGRNSRLDAIQAAILRVKLRHLDEEIERRREIAGQYGRGLATISSMVCPGIDKNSRHGLHLYVIRTPQRDAIARWLEDHGVQVGVHYPVALPALPAYSGLGLQHEFATALDLSASVLSLPIGSHLDNKQIDYVIGRLHEYQQLRD